MKRLLFAAMLFLIGYTAQAGPLYINNYTGCDIYYSVRAHDPSNLTCALQSNIIAIPAGSVGLVLYLNVGSLNMTPGWQGGIMATGSGPYGAYPLWAWDAIKFYASPSGLGGQVGSLTACSTNTTITVASGCGGANYYATWTPGIMSATVDFYP